VTIGLFDAMDNPKALAPAVAGARGFLRKIVLHDNELHEKTRGPFDEIHAVAMRAFSLKNKAAKYD
jgi:hypothetical protein